MAHVSVRSRDSCSSVAAFRVSSRHVCEPDRSVWSVPFHRPHLPGNPQVETRSRKNNCLISGELAKSFNAEGGLLPKSEIDGDVANPERVVLSRTSDLTESILELQTFTVPRRRTWRRIPHTLSLREQDRGSMVFKTSTG